LKWNGFDDSFSEGTGVVSIFGKRQRNVCEGGRDELWELPRGVSMIAECLRRIGDDVGSTVDEEDPQMSWISYELDWGENQSFAA